MMNNKLIENKTEVYWTVMLNGALWVKDYEMYRNEVHNLTLTNKENEIHKFNNLSSAVKVANYSKGKIFKSSRTTVITEVIEEVEVTEVN